MAVSRSNLANTMPLRDRVTDGRLGTVTRAWFEWLLSVATLLRNVPESVAVMRRSLLQASVAATDLDIGSNLAGLYRVTWHARITRAATTSSSLTVILRWTHGGIAQSKTFAAITGNTTSTTDTGTALISVDVGTPIRYETTYASVGATPMQHSLDIVVERVELE
jgi:hypothetical protein